MQPVDLMGIGVSVLLLVLVYTLGTKNVRLVTEVRVLTESIDRRPLPPPTDLITFANGRIRMQCYAASLDPSK